MKTVLKILVSFHISLVFIVCLNGLTQELMTDGKSINKYGAVLLKNIDLNIYDYKMFDALKVYGIYTGTARGYSFFSPNVSRVEKDFYFVSQDDQLIKPDTKYFETSFKFNAFKSGLFKEIFNTTDIDDHLSSLGAHLMSTNNSVDCIDMYLTYNKYNDLAMAKVDHPLCSTEEIHLFTLRKKK